MFASKQESEIFKTSPWWSLGSSVANQFSSKKIYFSPRKTVNDFPKNFKDRKLILEKLNSRVFTSVLFRSKAPHFFCAKFSPWTPLNLNFHFWLIFHFPWPIKSVSCNLSSRKKIIFSNTQLTWLGLRSHTFRNVFF